MSQVRQAVIGEYLKALRLPSFARRYEELARHASDGGWAYEDYLRELLEAEVISRQESRAARMLKAALFPDVKTLSQINWTKLEGVSRAKIVELSSCGFIEQAEDVVIAGPIGTGKTHLAIGLGVEATKRRKRVAFVRAASLVRSLIEARDERLLGRLQQKYQRVELLIIDELGFVPFDRTGGELLFNLLSHRSSYYESPFPLQTTPHSATSLADLHFGSLHFSGSQTTLHSPLPTACSPTSSQLPPDRKAESPTFLCHA